MADQQRNGIVTGAASGLGRALCVRLARDGWNLALVDVNDTENEETLHQVKAAGGSGRTELVDVTKIDQWQSLHERLAADWEHLDLLVNNAGVAGSGTMGTYSIDDWHWMVGVNLWNGIYGCHTFVDWLKRNPRGAHIINTASAAAIASLPTMAAYNVTKAGMLALSETLHSELAEHGVGVTVLCPAFVATNLLVKGRFGNDNQRRVAERGFKKSKLTAERVADLAVRAIERKELYVIVPRYARIAWYMKRLAPRYFLRSAARDLRKALQSRD